MRGEAEERQDDRDRHEAAEDAAHEPAHGDAFGQERTRRHADAVDDQDDRHDGVREAGELRHRRRDVAERREHAAEADDTDREREPHLRARQRLQFTGDGRDAQGALVRDPQPHRNDGEQRDDGDEGVRPLPAQMLPEPRRDGHADDVRHRQASEHHRHGPGAPVLLDEGGRDDGADAEERAVRHARDEAREQQHRVARGERRADVADEERDHESEQDVLARHLREQHRDERRTDDHAERVRRHRVTGARNRDAETPRDLRQQTHRDELRRADGETAERQRQDRQTGSRVAAVAVRAFGVDGLVVADVMQRGCFGHRSILPHPYPYPEPLRGCARRAFHHPSSPASVVRVRAQPGGRRVPRTRRSPGRATFGP